MKIPVNRLLFIFLFTFIFLSGCNQSGDQRDFEREAFSLPEGITETTEKGEIESRDPDDWRVAPFFQGLIEVDPVFPNPVQSTDQLSLDVIITGVESVSGLVVYAYYGDNNLRNVYNDLRTPIPPGLVSIPLSPLDIARFREDPQGTFRIILLDRNENVITYGDVRIE